MHFDAHLDTWDTYFNAPVTHGTIFRRAFEEGLLVEDHSIHVGIRGPIYDQADLNDDARMGFRIIRAGDLDVMGIEAAVDVVRRRVGDVPVYVSIDIDVLDPAFAPGTGTPEAGGLTSRELLRMLRQLTGLNVVGATSSRWPRPTITPRSPVSQPLPWYSTSCRSWSRVHSATPCPRRPKPSAHRCRVTESLNFSAPDEAVPRQRGTAFCGQNGWRATRQPRLPHAAPG